MAMLNWQGWAVTNFVGWGAAGTVTPPAVVIAPDVGHVGKKRRRKRYLIEGRLLLLTDEELHAYLLRLLRRKKQEQVPPAPAKKAQPAPKPAAEPIAVADFGLLSSQMQAQPSYVQIAADLAHERWAKNQPEILRALHDLALGMEADALEAADEDDLEVLLLM